MKAILATFVLFLGCALSPEAAAQEEPLSPNAEAAIGAATSFAVGYGVWLWEKKCAKLPPEESVAFNAAVTGQMQRFSGMLDLQLFKAILGTGQDTSNDPASAPPCEDPDALDFARFGVDMVKDSAEKLATIPAGYHLTLTN